MKKIENGSFRFILLGVKLALIMQNIIETVDFIFGFQGFE